MDIVDRLRLAAVNSAYLNARQWTAADEIEKMRADGKKDYAGMCDMQAKFMAADHKARKLEDDVAHWKSQYHDVCTQRDAVVVDAEGLSAAVARLKQEAEDAYNAQECDR